MSTFKPKSLVWIHKALVALVLCCLIGPACQRQQSEEPIEYLVAARLMLDWNKILLEMERHTPGYRPPVSARMFAYVEMAAYEAALPAMQNHISLEKYCQGYDAPARPSGAFYLPAAVNSAYSQILKMFFPTAPTELLQKSQQLEAAFDLELADDVSSGILRESAEFGKAAARAVWLFSATDSSGHDGFMYNYDRNFKPCTQPGCWQSATDRPMPALLPGWGATRKFVVNDQEVASRPPVPFSELSNSAFYSAAMEVFSISQSLSSEDKWIAEFWSDDLPGFTITPAGRWFSITNQALEKAQPGFVVMLETYLRVGLALCDAGVVCWDSKYKYQLERPYMYIQRNIQPGWDALHPTPSFPAYPSGHAIFGASASAVLSHMLGQQFEMTDNTHNHRKEFAGKPRSFNSFEEMAAENAYSRVLLGVHFRMDCEEGLRLGKIIGHKVVSLPLMKDKVAWNTN